MKSHGSPAEQAFIFPSVAVAIRCVKFFEAQVPSLVTGQDLRILNLYPHFSLRIGTRRTSEDSNKPFVSAVIFPRDHSKIAKIFWQHSGDGISSRRAEFCHKTFNSGLLSTYVNGDECISRASDDLLMLTKGPRRYQKGNSLQSRQMLQSQEIITSIAHNQITSEGKEHIQFLEERFGRNLDTSLAANAKLAIRRRIAGVLIANVELDEALELTQATMHPRQVQGFSEHDIFLFPTGMSAIFNTHRMLMACRGELQSICFGHASPSIS